MTEGDSGSISSLGPVGDWERLGRRVFSRSVAKQAANNKAPLKLFREKRKQKLSVDRLTMADEANIAIIVADALNAAANRPQPPNTFCGWAIVVADQIRNVGCRVIDSPMSTNLYHADIVLPDDAMDSEDAQRQYAATLAGMSRWKPAPVNPTG